MEFSPSDIAEKSVRIVTPNSSDFWEFTVGVFNQPFAYSIRFENCTNITKNGAPVADFTEGDFPLTFGVSTSAYTIELDEGSSYPYLETSADGLKAKVAGELASAIEGELADASQINTKFAEIQQEIDDLIVDLPNYVGVDAIVVDDDAGVDGEISLKLVDEVASTTDLELASMPDSDWNGTYEYLGAGNIFSNSVTVDPALPTGFYGRSHTSGYYFVAYNPSPVGWAAYKVTPSQGIQIVNAFAAGVIAGIQLNPVPSNEFIPVFSDTTQNDKLAPESPRITYVGGSGSSEVSYLTQSAEGLKAVVADSYASAGADQLMDAQDIKDQFQVVEDTKQDNISAGNGIEINGVAVGVKLDESGLGSTDLVISNTVNSVNGTYTFLGSGYIQRSGVGGDNYFVTRDDSSSYAVYLQNDSNPAIAVYDDLDDYWYIYEISSPKASELEFIFAPPAGGGSVDVTFNVNRFIITNASQTENGKLSPQSNGGTGTDYVSVGGSGPYLLNSANGLKAKVAADYASAQAGELMDADDIRQAISSAGRESVKQTFLLTATNIANKYVDLDQVPKPMSCDVTPVGGPLQEEGVDYTISGNRLFFAGDLDADLAVGDKLMVKYVF